jgi:hypothetical protein
MMCGLNMFPVELLLIILNYKDLDGWGGIATDSLNHIFLLSSTYEYLNYL